MLEMHKHSRAANNSPFGEAASLSPPWIADGGRNEWANESGSAVEKFSKRIATGEGGSWYGSAAALSLRILRREVKAKSFRETRRGIESPFPSGPLGAARLGSVTLREFFFAGPVEPIRPETNFLVTLENSRFNILEIAFATGNRSVASKIALFKY